MSARTLPIPKTRRPLPRIHPRSVPESYVELLGVIYHAEVAALDAFERLTDPAMVMPCEALLRPRAMLIRDERAHLEDIENVVRQLGVASVPLEHAAFTDLWSVEKARRRLLYPLPPHVAAMFILITESLGYAILYHLADRTTEAAIAKVLASNIEDEKAHLRASMHVLKQTLKTDRGRAAALADMAAHLLAFGILSRDAGKHLSRVLKGLGWDAAEVGSSATRFTTALFMQVFEDVFGASFGTRAAHVLSAQVLSPPMIRAFEASAWMPTPSFLWPVLRGAAARLREGTA